MQLYRIGNALTEILASIPEDGEISPEQLQAISAMEGQFADKAQDVACVIQHAKAYAEAAAAQAKRLTELARVKTNLAERLSDYLQNQMELTGQLKVETPLFKMWIQRNGAPSVNYDGDPAALPPGMQRVKVEVDKKAIADAAKAGGTLPDGVTVVYNNHLRIK